MYESATIDGIELVFDEEADDVIIKMIRDIRDCPVWGCKECSKKISLKISHVASLLSNIVKPDDGYIIDIGCHIGTCSLPLAKMGYDIAAIDGSDRSITCLQEAAKRNDLSNIKAVKSVLSNGRQPCAFPQSIESDSTMKFSALPVDANILTSTLDQLVLEQKTFASFDKECSLIKIDVGGYEKIILQGGEFTIANHRPVLYLEIDNSRLYSRGIKPVEVLNSLRKLDYHIAYPYWNLEDDLVSFREIDPLALFPFGVRDIVCFHKKHNVKDEIMNFIINRWLPPHSHKKLYQMLLTARDENPDSPHMDYYNSLITSELK